MITIPTRTVLDLLEDQLDGLDAGAPASVAEGIGQIHMHLHSLQGELCAGDAVQDAEKIFQDYVRIACISVSTAARHVLPAIQSEDRPE